MQTKTLDAKTAKGEPNIVKISNAKLTGDPKNPQKFEINAERFEFQVPDSWQEVVQSAGSEDQALAFVRAAWEDAATTAGKNYIRNASSGSPEQIVAEGLKRTLEWTPAAVERVTAAEIKKEFEDIRTNIQNMSPEEVYQRMLKFAGR